MVYIYVSVGDSLLTFVKKYVDNVQRKDLKVNGKIKINVRKIACGDNYRLKAVKPCRLPQNL